MYKKEAKDKLIDYEKQMRIDELSDNTIKKYLFDIEQWLEHQNMYIDMESMIEYKKLLVQMYSASSVNSKLISVNRYLKWIRHGELVLKTKRLQQRTSVENIISKNEYNRMLEFAKKTNRNKMYYILRTIVIC